jgi:hypothetical protein
LGGLGDKKVYVKLSREQAFMYLGRTGRQDWANIAVWALFISVHFVLKN